MYLCNLCMDVVWMWYGCGDSGVVDMYE